MKLSIIILASLMTSCCVLAAPPLKHDEKIPPGQENHAQLRKQVLDEVRGKMWRGAGKKWKNEGRMTDDQWTAASEADQLIELWEMHKQKYGRKFNTGSAEAMRRKNFENKLAQIIKHNIEAKMNLHQYTMSLNHMSDWTKQELATLRGYRPVMLNDYSDYNYAVDDIEAQDKAVAQAEQVVTYLPVMPTYTNTVPTSQLPASVNWSSTPWVGPVQNQHQCGSCWTFSACGALEAQYYNKTGTFVTLSEQNLVDCTYYLGNLGCSGGNVELAFDYIMTVGIDSFASYPYRGQANNATCLYTQANSVTKLSSWRLIPSGNELALQQAVALAGPVSVAIDASLSTFDYYSGGVYAPTDCSTTALDHAVLVVGYGTTTEGQDYWLIKNSWGVDWGINGYMMMERGVNMCGVATEAVFPVID